MAMSSMRNYSSTEMFNSSTNSSSSASRILDHHFGTGLNFQDLFGQFKIWIEKNMPDCRDIFSTKSIRDSFSTAVSTSTMDKFQVKLDVQQFAADEITVKVCGGNTISVEGQHEERQDDYGFVTRHFLRRYVIPDGFDIKNVVTNLSSDGVLSIIAPRMGQDISEHRRVPIRQSEFASRFFNDVNSVRQENRSAQQQQQQRQQHQESVVQINRRTASSTTTSDGYRMVPIQHTGVTHKQTLEYQQQQQQQQKQTTRNASNYNEVRQQQQQQQTKNEKRDEFRNVPIQQTGVSSTKQQQEFKSSMQTTRQQEQQYRNVPIQQTGISSKQEYERQETKQQRQDEYRTVPIQQTGISSRTMQQETVERKEEQYRNVPIQQTGVSSKSVQQSTTETEQRCRNIPIQQVEETTNKKKQVSSADYVFEPSPKIKEIEERYKNVLDAQRTEESIDLEDTEIRERQRLQNTTEQQCRNVPVQQSSKLYEETRTEEYVSSNNTKSSVPEQIIPSTITSEYEREQKQQQQQTTSRSNEYEKEQRTERTESSAPVTSVKIREYTEQEIIQTTGGTSNVIPIQQQSIESSKQEEFYSSSSKDEVNRRGGVPVHPQVDAGLTTTSKTSEYEEQRFSQQQVPSNQSAAMTSSTTTRSEFQKEQQQIGTSSKTNEYEEQRMSSSQQQERQVGRAVPMQQQHLSKSFEETKKQEYSSSSSKSSSSQQQQQRRYTGNLSSSSMVNEHDSHIIPASHHNQADFSCRRESVSSCTENGITSKVSEFQKKEMSQQNGVASKSNEYKKEETVQQIGNPSPLSSKRTENKEHEVRCVIQEVTDGVDSVPVEYTRMSSQASSVDNHEHIIPVELL